MSAPAWPCNVSLPSAPGKQVGAGVAGQQVVKRIAGAAAVGGAGEGEVFQFRAKDIVAVRQNRVDAAACNFNDAVPRAVDNIGVVVVAAGHGVVALAAVQQVEAETADQPVIAVVAEQPVVAREGAVAAVQRVIACAADDFIVAGAAEAGEPTSLPPAPV